MLSIVTITAILAALAPALAQQQHDGTARLTALTLAPFALVPVTEAGMALDANPVFSCHEGAATRSLCVHPARPGSPYPADASVLRFHHNATDLRDPNSPGQLVWKWSLGDRPVQSSMVLTDVPGTNLAVPILSLSASKDAVTFDDAGFMSLGTRHGEVAAMGDWYTCVARFSYEYNRLVWVEADGLPQGKNCQKVRVLRRFV